MLEEVPEGKDGLTPEERKYFRLLTETVGVGGIMLEKPTLQEQDKEATPAEGYVVAFFPRIGQLGPATLSWPRVSETFSQTPETAIARFMDGIKKGEEWERYQEAGHRVRKVRLIDLGDA